MAGNANSQLDGDSFWKTFREQWTIRADTTYLNHGSFGPPSQKVRDCQLKWQAELACQPMDFFVRRFEPLWLSTRDSLAEFVKTTPSNLVFTENATVAMNVVANSVALGPGDEVLLTDHEYGAVLRIWERACQLAGAREPCIARLPATIESPDQVVESILYAITPRTRVLVVSHVTSPTAIILPIHQICEQAKQLGVCVCVDGPHAPAQVPLAIDALGCDFYTASLHKWVSAPIGAGFLYAAPAWHDRIQTPLLSWGRLRPHAPETWWEEFIWPGTRDPSAYLAVPTALELLHEVGLETFRSRTHGLARYARQRLTDLFGTTPTIPDSEDWYGSMVSVPLPDGLGIGLQQALWEHDGIEVPVMEHNGVPSIRVSCHLYTLQRDIDALVSAVQRHLRL